MIHEQQQSAHAREGVLTPKMATSRPKTKTGGEKPLIYADLVRAGAAPGVADEILRIHPDLSPDRFASLCQAAARRGSSRSQNSVGLVFWCLLHRQDLHSPSEERHDSPSTKRSAPPHRAQRSAPQPAAPAPAVDYDALLAEIAAANPGMRL